MFNTLPNRLPAIHIFPAENSAALQTLLPKKRPSECLNMFLGLSIRLFGSMVVSKKALLHHFQSRSDQGYSRASVVQYDRYAVRVRTSFCQSGLVGPDSGTTERRATQHWLCHGRTINIWKRAEK